MPNLYLEKDKREKAFNEKIKKIDAQIDKGYDRIAVL